MSRWTLFVLCAASMLLSAVAAGSERELARLGGMEERELAVAAFELAEPGEVEISATVLRGSRSRVWILDGSRRELVWEPNESTPRDSSRYLDRWRQSVRLDAGRYELYYAAWLSDNKSADEGSGLLAGVVREMVGFSAPPEVLADLGVVARGRGKPIELGPRLPTPEAVELVVLDGRGDGELEERSFELSQPATVEIYAVGEVGTGGWADWGWLVDADSRRTLWELSWDNSEPAGGWDVNRRARTRLDLRPGTYAVGFQTDRGHSFEGWVAPPPYDPSAWGIRVLCVDGPGCATVQPSSVERLPAALEIARLTGLRDGERRELPFRVRGTTRVRVYALGEGARRGLWDRGWIERVGSGEKVWQMEFESLRPAGGSPKNLRADEVVELAPGDYVAVYETDDSHSVGGGWNASPPLEADRWGMTLLALSGGLAPR